MCGERKRCTEELCVFDSVIMLLQGARMEKGFALFSVGRWWE